MPSLSLESKLEVLAQRDRRFAIEAFQFVFESLDFVLSHPTCRKSLTSRHITVLELLDGMRRIEFNGAAQNPIWIMHESARLGFQVPQ